MNHYSQLMKYELRYTYSSMTTYLQSVQSIMKQEQTVSDIRELGSKNVRIKSSKIGKVKNSHS